MLLAGLVWFRAFVSRGAWRGRRRGERKGKKVYKSLLSFVSRREIILTESGKELLMNANVFPIVKHERALKQFKRFPHEHYDSQHYEIVKEIYIAI
jgi:hypothetical protein